VNVGSKRKEEWETDEYRIALLSLWKCNGRTNQQIAKQMGITYTTLKVWLNESEAIREALNTGKRELSDKLAGAMTRRAFGYDYEETKTVIVGDVRKGSKIIENQQTVKVEKIKKHQPADLGAQIFMLTNLRPEEWKNRPVDKDILKLEKEIRMLEKRKLEKELGEGGTTSAVDDWVSSIPDVIEKESSDDDEL